MIRAVAIAILSAVLAHLLGEEGYRGKRLFSALAAVLIFLIGISLFDGVGSQLSGLLHLTGVGETAFAAMKVVGMGYIFGIAADITRELGEAGIATALITVGRIEIFVTVLPYIIKMVELGASLIK